MLEMGMVAALSFEFQAILLYLLYIDLQHLVCYTTCVDCHLHMYY